MFYIDGVRFRGCVSLSRRISLQESYRVMTEDNLNHREVSAKKTGLTVEFSRLDAEEYDALHDKLSELVEYHTISYPATATENATIEAMITEVTDEITRSANGRNIMNNLKVTFDER